MSVRVFAVSWEDVDWNTTAYALGWVAIGALIGFLIWKHLREASRETVSTWFGWGVFFALFFSLNHFVPNPDCADGSQSDSIGLRGACSSHGGVRRYAHLSVLALIASATVGFWVARKIDPPIPQPTQRPTSVEIPPSSEQIIRASIVLKRRISFEYQSRREHQPMSRTIVPSSVSHGRYATTVTGFCDLRQAERTFVLRRMQNVRPHE